MDTEYKAVPYSQDFERIHRLSIAKHHKHDKESDSARWVVNAEVRGKSVDAIVITARQGQFEAPYYKENLDPNPAPFTLSLTTYRFRRQGGSNEAEMVSLWNFSKTIQPGDSFRIRLDPFIDALKDNVGTPYDLHFNVRIRDGRSLQVEYTNTASEVLLIESSYELISKEIMALHSEHFKNLYFCGLNDSTLPFEYFEHLSPDSGEERFLIRALDGEAVRDFEKGMRMLLAWLHYRTFIDVTSENAHLLFSVLERYQCGPINRHLDTHLWQHCQRSPDDNTLDAALLLTQKHHLPETAARVPVLYETPERVSEAFDLMRHEITATTTLGLFDAYRWAETQLHYMSCVYVFFKFQSGNAIVQLNRVGLPLTVGALLDAPAPVFEWESRNRLVSTAPVPLSLRLHAERGSRSNIPEGTWALLLQTLKEPRDRTPEGPVPHYVLTTDRPQHGLYLGFVVKGEEHLSSKPHCEGVGLHHLQA